MVAANTFSSGSADILSILTYSGLYNVLYTVGFTSPYELFICQIGFLILALLTGVLTLIHTSLRDSIGLTSSLSGSRGLLSELLALPTILGIEELSEEDKLTVERARKAERYLSQPFFVAETFTGLGGTYVPLSSAIANAREILQGFRDYMPEGAFYMQGTLPPCQ